MDLNQIPLAAEALHAAIRSFRTVKDAMLEVLAEFDVTEAAVRARFEKHYRLTPEEVAQRNVTDFTIEGYLEKFKKANSNYHPSRIKYLGKRFYFMIKGNDGREEKKWFRFLISHGNSVTCVSELTHREAEIVDSAVLDDVARQIGWKRWPHWS